MYVAEVIDLLLKDLAKAEQRRPEIIRRGFTRVMQLRYWIELLSIAADPTKDIPEGIGQIQDDVCRYLDISHIIFSAE